MKKLTIKDIANLAGVSFKTVSRVLNKEQNVKKETREKIEKILLETNFSINYNAKRLSISRTKQIGLVTNTVLDYELNKNYIIMNYIVNYARKRGYTILVNRSFKELVKNNFDKIDSGFYEGLIFLNPKNSDEVEKAVQSNLPVVISGISEKYIYVGTDQYESAYIATETLIRKGCKDICILLGDSNTKTTNEKYRGYKQVIDKFKMKENVYYNYSSSEEVEKFIISKYKDKKLPDGLVINSDYAALGAIRAINKLGIKCPEKLKIISFGNTFICNEVYPSLSSMKQKFDIIAKELVDKIIYMIENEGKKAQSYKIPAELVERDTILK
ncbi:LacI family DNA-binding transcriptional regulator [Caviibacter abscessus]|uniref:LacI family DNA-binding transcriptional regulator n=1 Tax=Caviibacter abscessus TaxID=1766719 RepID=UPI000834CC9E|nr:LacI family DNA-binding transcriptional regulator [Caviibacter abscessus]